MATRSATSRSSTSSYDANEIAEDSKILKKNGKKSHLGMQGKLHEKMRTGHREGVESDSFRRRSQNFASVSKLLTGLV